MCKHCGAEKTGTGWGEDLYACGMTSGHPADVRTSECLRREVRQITTDRDQLRSELERVRRNHLRRMARVSGMRSREMFDEARMTEEGHDPDSWLRRNSRRLFKLATACRAALARTEAER